MDGESTDASIEGTLNFVYTKKSNVAIQKVLKNLNQRQIMSLFFETSLQASVKNKALCARATVQLRSFNYLEGLKSN